MKLYGLSVALSLLLIQPVFSEDNHVESSSQGGEDYFVIPVGGDWGGRPYGPSDFCIYGGNLYISPPIAKAYGLIPTPEGSAENPIVISDDDE